MKAQLWRAQSTIRFSPKSRVSHYSTWSPERIHVPCGSAGHVAVDLFNIAHYSSTSPLIIHFPPLPASEGQPGPSLPNVLRGWPVASINYRWKRPRASLPEDIQDDSSITSSVCGWPLPAHDAALAFAWLLQNLRPSDQVRRDVYVYGSHIGASLATSLSLTESHSHAPFGVRGVVAYNGIFNWTMFLPDHRIHRPRSSKSLGFDRSRLAEGIHLTQLQQDLPWLFDTPENLFDPFASPSLFFHNPGLNVPQSFTFSSSEQFAISSLIGRDEEYILPAKAPRKSHLTFPSLQSTLKIPETLLLHDIPPKTLFSGSKRRSKIRGHSFASQAAELGELMRRSIEKHEPGERGQWDNDLEGLKDETLRRVQIMELGEEQASQELDEEGQRIVSDWLEDRCR